jgi:hypothetical protein
VKQAWVVEIVQLIAQVTPGLIKEFLASDVDSEQYRRINALEASVDQLRAELAELRQPKRKDGGK